MAISSAASRREIELLRAEVSAARTDADAARLDTAAARARADAAQAAADVAAKGRWRWVVACISFAATAALSLTVAGIGAWADLGNTQFGAQEDREKESREKKAQVYADYLAAARAVLHAREDLQAANFKYVSYNGAASTNHLTQQSLALRNSLNKSIDSLDAAGVAWNKQEDLLFVYGSYDAWKLDSEFVKALGRFLSDEADRSVFGSTEWKFRVLYCREVTPLPRDGC